GSRIHPLAVSVLSAPVRPSPRPRYGTGCLRRTPVFFSQRHVDHLDLHSFPTRRSSDLVDTRALTKEIREHGVMKAAIVDEIQARSEEHTSELQSRFDLVCRLLLEKKKPRASYGGRRRDRSGERGMQSIGREHV